MGGTCFSSGFGPAFSVFGMGGDGLGEPRVGVAHRGSGSLWAVHHSSGGTGLVSTEDNRDRQLEVGTLVRWCLGFGSLLGSGLLTSCSPSCACWSSLVSFFVYVPCLPCCSLVWSGLALHGPECRELGSELPPSLAREYPGVGLHG